MKFYCHIMAAVALTVLSPLAVLYAQERAAAGTLDTQMTWTALTNVAKAASDKAEAVNSRVDQVVVCGKKGMTYAPGQNGADTQGCLTPQNITKIVDCGKQGAVYSEATDACIKTSQARWYNVGKAASTASSCNRNYQCSTWGIAPPAGYPICGTTDGIVARVCDSAAKRCARVASASSTVWNPGQCTNIMGDSQNCSSPGNVTSTSTWYELYACE